MSFYVTAQPDPTFLNLLSQSLPQSVAAGFEQGRESSLLRNILNIPDEQQRLRALVSSGVSPERLKPAYEHLVSEQGYSTIEKNFGKKVADLWKYSPTGARTEIVKNAFEAKKRGIPFEEFLNEGGIGAEQEAETQQAVKRSEVNPNFVYPSLEQEKGLTPRERYERTKEYRKENAEPFEKAETSFRRSRAEGASLLALENLNESGRLPEGLERLLIDPETGEPRALASLVGVVSPETQLWSKLINDFTRNAKDSYGARVTNFDLQQFLKRFPGLLNTPEGRRLILSKIRIINAIDNLESSAVQEVYTHYGLGNISREKAVKTARNMIKDDVEQLERDFASIPERPEGGSTFNSLPDPKDLKGRSIVNKNTGQTFISTGKEWKEVK